MLVTTRQKTKHKPTAQQIEIVDHAAVKRETGKVKARAGTGKTLTAEYIAEELPKIEIGYMVFNKAAQLEADARMPENVNSRTGHSLAWMATFRGKKAVFVRKQTKGPFALVAEVENDRVLAPLLDLADGNRRAAAFAVVNTLTQWCQTADGAPSESHVPTQTTARLESAAQRKSAAKAVAKVAMKLWERITAKGSRLPHTHDMYFKYWQLMKPKLPYDLMILDESQDLSAVMLDVVNQQSCQIIAFGDDQQQIYAWRGAVNAMQHIPGKVLPLTRSWRFGPEVAGMANRVLTIVGEEWLVEGSGPPGVVIDNLNDVEADAVLCRGNAGVIRETLASLDRGKTTGVCGGTKDAVDLLYATYALYMDRDVDHPEIGIFLDWDEFDTFCDTDEGQGYRPVRNLVLQNGTYTTILAKRLKPVEWGGETVGELEAEVVVSTAHKAKGREWPSVRLCDDFSPLTEETDEDKYELNPEEANLAYVTLTRAKSRLNMAGWGAQFAEDERRMHEMRTKGKVERVPMPGLF